MRNVLIFLAGAVLGAVITFLVYSLSSYNAADNIRLFSTPGRNIKATSFEVVHVLDFGAAVVKVKNGNDSTTNRTNAVLMNKQGDFYHDDQIIDVPKGKCVKQIGVFTHDAHSGIVQSIPLLDIYSR